MDVRSTVSVGVLLLCLLLPVRAQSNNKDQGHPPHPHAYKHDNSLVEYTLRQINPSDLDYGSRWEWWRKAFVERTLENQYFWSNTAALVLLACLLLTMVWQRNKQNRRDSATTEVLAQYDHALTRANLHIQELTSKNSALANAVVQKREDTGQPASASPFLASGLSPEAEVPSSERAGIEPSRTAVLRAGRRAQSQVRPTDGGNQTTLFAPEVDLMMTVNSLKQQLAHSEERNTVLQRQMASASRTKEPSHRHAGSNLPDGRSTTAG